MASDRYWQGRIDRCCPGIAALRDDDQPLDLRDPLTPVTGSAAGRCRAGRFSAAMTDLGLHRQKLIFLIVLCQLLYVR